MHLGRPIGSSSKLGGYSKGAPRGTTLGYYLGAPGQGCGYHNPNHGAELKNCVDAIDAINR